MRRDNWLHKNFPFLSMEWVYDFVVWLGMAAVDKVQDKPSSRKIVALMSATAMCIGILALLLAKAYWVYQHGGDIYWELGAIAVPLCTLAGYNYKAGVESSKPQEPPAKPQEPTIKSPGAQE